MSRPPLCNAQIINTTFNARVVSSIPKSLRARTALMHRMERDLDLNSSFRTFQTSPPYQAYQICPFAAALVLPFTEIKNIHMITARNLFSLWLFLGLRFIVIIVVACANA
jgi:hypothetical protein